MAIPEVLVPPDIELTPTKVNLARTKRIIAKEYDSIQDGLQKEAIQNAWDNRVDQAHALGWKVIISYDPETRNLSIEDFGTTGIVQWEFFHALWYTDKESSPAKLGKHGQGKAMLHACGEYLITETQVNGQYLCRYSTPEGHADFEGKKHRELDHDGALITVYKVYPDLHKDFTDTDPMVRLIQLTWWQIIEEHGATIIYAVGPKRVTVPKLALPTASLKLFDDRVVQKGSTAFGVLSKIRFYYADSDVPEDLRGIAVNVNGQTIDRYHPPLIGHHAKKFFATCSADFLVQAERSSHSGFQANNPAWKAAREVLDNLLAEFVQPMMKHDTTVAPRYRKLAEQMLDEINNVLLGFPDLDPQSIMPKTKGPTAGTAVTRTDVYYMSVVTEKPLYLRGETARITTHSANPLPVRKDGYREEVQVRDPNNTIVWTMSQAVTFDPNSERTYPYLYVVPADATLGTYIVTAFIYNGAAVPRATRIKIFQVELAAPPTPIRKEATGTPSSRAKHKGHGLGLIHPIKQRDESKPGPESYFVREQNMLVINMSHPTAKYLETNDPRGFRYHFFKCASDQLVKERYRRLIDGLEEDTLSAAEVEKLLNDLFTRKQEFFAAWGKAALTSGSG